MNNSKNSSKICVILWELLIFFNYLTLDIQVYYSSSNLICELTREEKKKTLALKKKSFHTGRKEEN